MGPEHMSTLSIVHNLGSLYRDLGKLDEAERLYQRALAGYEKALLSDNIPALAAVRNFGLLYRVQGRLKEAKTMFQLALSGIEKLLGPDHSYTLEVVNYLKGITGQNGWRDHFYGRVVIFESGRVLMGNAISPKRSVK